MVMMMLTMTMLKPVGVDCTLCPTTSESLHLGPSTRELSSSLHPALAPLSLGCCTGPAQNHSLATTISNTATITTTAAAAVTTTTTARSYKLHLVYLTTKHQHQWYSAQQWDLI